MSEIDPQLHQYNQSTENDSRANSDNSHNSDDQFICGVIEGFYGKPWTFEQRRDLFKFLKQMNLNAFLYAPKDDAKHRARWREMYSEAEAIELQVLINEAALNGINFYYSLAPGLDMIYSSPDDLNILRQKYDQLRRLGCKSFAILFDDIEPRIIHEKDRSVFDNYAEAQVSVSNMIYDYLNRPKFLFCPTEYCESRAVPSVPDSRYLNTMGSGLHLGIDFLWSGSRVISRYITEESIQELTQVIRRPPVIWENLHANDYDKKRVYLGPYSGRSTKIIPKLRGVLTNPNCEYEANYIAIHTLAQWSRCTEDANPHNRCDQDTQMAAAMGSLPLQDETKEQKESVQNQPAENVYDPDRALVRAIRDWLPHVLSAKSLPHGDQSLRRDMRNDSLAESQITKEIGCEVQHDCCPDMATDEQMKDVELSSSGTPNQANNTNSAEEGHDEEDLSVKTPTSDMDTSGSPAETPETGAEQATSHLIVDSNSCDSCEMQDASSAENQSSQALKNNDIKVTAPPTPDIQPIVDCIVCSANNLVNSQPIGEANQDNNNSMVQKVDLDSLALVVDFFYLPFEHGLRGHALLSDIKWLVDNSEILIPDKPSDDQETRMNDEEDNSSKEKESEDKLEQQQEASSISDKQPVVDSKLVELWIERAERLSNLCYCINRIVSTIIHECPNKFITADLYPYLSELRDVLVMMTDYIKFLRHRRSHSDRFYFSSGPKRSENVALCDEQEPWVRRGGLIGDMQRLIS